MHVSRDEIEAKQYDTQGRVVGMIAEKFGEQVVLKKL